MINAHILLLVVAAICFFAAAVIGFANRPYSPHIGSLLRAHLREAAVVEAEEVELALLQQLRQFRQPGPQRGVDVEHLG